MRRLRAVPTESMLHMEFSNPVYQLINVARLQHLDSLGLDLSNKTIIEFGAGVGDHTLFYLYKNCKVLPIEGRPDLAHVLSQRLGLETKVIDLEKDIERVGEISGYFDIAHCYGILYHLAEPEAFLAAASKTADLMLLETCVSDRAEKPGINRVPEVRQQKSQSMSGTGCRPDRAWIFRELNKHYRFVYMPTTQPKHRQFPTDWTNLRTEPDQLVRSVFVASQHKLDSKRLTEKIVTHYAPW